jgi:hypothetical protein
MYENPASCNVVLAYNHACVRQEAGKEAEVDIRPLIRSRGSPHTRAPITGIAACSDYPPGLALEALLVSLDVAVKVVG